MAGKPIDPSIRAGVEAALVAGASDAATAGQFGIDRRTVASVRRQMGLKPLSYHQHTPPPPACSQPVAAGGPPLAGGCPPSVLDLPPASRDQTQIPPVGCPDAFEEHYEPYKIDNPGLCLTLSDIHVPFHERVAVETAVADGKKKGVTTVLLNGDTFDFYMLSRFSQDPSKPRVRQEINTARDLFRWLRQEFPKARIVFKEGNHDERFRRFLADRAPEVFDLECMDLRAISGANDYGLEWVAEKRVVWLGKLPVVHGHEFAGGGGVSPARWLYLRTVESAMCGHFHQSTDFAFRRPLSGKLVRTWSTGCLCKLQPQYRPLNQWSHGFALVEVANDGTYQVTNRAIMGGRVV